MILRRHLTWRLHLFLPVTVSPPHAPPSGVQSAKFCKAIASSAVLHSAYQYWPIASIVYVMLASVLSCHCRNLCHDAQGLCTVALNNPTTSHPLNTHYIRSTCYFSHPYPPRTPVTTHFKSIHVNWKPWHFDFWVLAETCCYCGEMGQFGGGKKGEKKRETMREDGGKRGRVWGGETRRQGV